MVSDSSATIHWLPPDPANGNTTQYLVNVEDDGGNDILKTFSGSILQGTFDAEDGLKPCINYTVSIRAQNDVGLGDWSAFPDPFIIYFDGESKKHADLYQYNIFFNYVCIVLFEYSSISLF